MQKLWLETNKPGLRRSPVRIKRHSRFLAGRTLTFVGTRWVRTYGFLPKGDNRVTWTGGIVWAVKGMPYATNRPLDRPRLAVCKWRCRRRSARRKSA